MSWNRFVYASDDPVNRNDPSGRDDCPTGELGERAFDLPGCNQNDFEYKWISSTMHGLLTLTSSIQIDVDPYNPSAGYGLGLSSQTKSPAVTIPMDAHTKGVEQISNGFTA